MRALHLPSPRLPPSPALTHTPMSPGVDHATRSLSSNDTSFHLHDGQSDPYQPTRTHSLVACDIQPTPPS